MTKRREKKNEARQTKRCAIYTRKSVARGLEQAFNSLDAQRDTCEQYIRTQAHAGWELLSEAYDDGGFSGKDMDRPAFQRLMADVDAGKIDTVVVYKIDRLSRSLLDFAQLMQRFERAGASFVAVTQNFSTADAIGRLTLNLLMSFAEFEREMISERTRDKIAASRRRGHWTGGPPPFGYALIEKKLVVQEHDAAIVREIFALYDEHRSARIVAEQLGARRVGGRRWNKVSVLNALRNPAYVGLIAHDGERHVGQHDAIVERALFERAQAILAENSQGPCAAPRNPRYLLTGLLRCALCGAAMTSATTRKRAREYRYYRCTTRDKVGAAACPAGPMPAGPLEQFVVDRMRESTADGELADEVEAQLRSRIEVRRSALSAERAELPRRIGRLSASSRAILETLVEADTASRLPLEERLAETRGEIESSELRVREVESALLALNDARGEAKWIGQVLRDFDPIWEALIPDNRVRLVRVLVRTVEIHEPTGMVEVRLHALGSAAGEGEAA